MRYAKTDAAGTGLEGLGEHYTSQSPYTMPYTTLVYKT